MLTQYISDLCDCDVAVSDDNTGHAYFAADWELEYTAGTIETEIAFSDDLQQSWGNLLNVTLDNSTVGISPKLQFSHNMTHNTGAGSDRFMLVAVSFGQNNNEGVASVFYDGQPLSFVDAHFDSGAADKQRVEMWQLVNPNVGNNTLTVNFTNNTYEGAVIGITTFAEVDQATPLRSQRGKAIGDSDTQTVTVPTAPAEMVFGALAYKDSNDYEFTALSGAERYESFVGLTNGTGTTLKTVGVLSDDVIWDTTTNSTWAALGVSIQAANPSDPPTITGLSADTLNYFEDDPAAVIEQENDVIVNDSDSSNFNGGRCRILQFY